MMDEKHIAEVVADAIYDPHNTRSIDADEAGAWASGVLAEGRIKYEAWLTVSIFNDEDAVINIEPSLTGEKVESIIPVSELDDALIHEVALSMHRQIFRRNRWYHADKTAKAGV